MAEFNHNIVRLNLDYEYQGGIHLSLGYISYNSSSTGENSSTLYPYRSNDRISSSIVFYY
ncbi:MAG: hypothetical protein OEM38_04560 [Gammaproteobacteria bacterium]|nr:hypothetical protein [Gammaproteobacteria bacterium]